MPDLILNLKELGISEEIYNENLLYFKDPKNDIILPFTYHPDIGLSPEEYHDRALLYSRMLHQATGNNKILEMIQALEEYGVAARERIKRREERIKRMSKYLE